MPDEVGVLLPSNIGPKRLIDNVVNQSSLYSDAIIGLFMSNPLLNVDLESRRLTQAGVRWITNLPSIEQQDEEFSQQLADVALDRKRELECLARFCSHGFKIASVVADGRGAAAATSVKPSAMIVLPRVSDFAAGFPSLRQREVAAQDITEATRQAGWEGLLLGLGEERETENERLWPNTLNGLVCRPVPAPA